jgi:flagellar biogenesis protein FliO
MIATNTGPGNALFLEKWWVVARDTFLAFLLPVRRQARRTKTLRVQETLALGEKRFLAVVECGQQRFLIGCTATSLSLLASLKEDSASFPQTLDESGILMEPK